MKAAIVIYSDPGSEEALGRCYSALSTAYEYAQHTQDVVIIFGGAGVRWPEQLGKSEHPAHALYQEVKDKVQGACSSCAAVYSTTESVTHAAVDLIGGVRPPGSMGSGLPSMRALALEGYTIFSY